MKVIINGKLYDTETSTEILTFKDTFIIHTIFKSKKGNYYLFAQPNKEAVSQIICNLASKELTRTEVINICSKYLSVEKIIILFNEVGDIKDN